MMTSVIRARSGTKVMPVTANMHPAPRFVRYPNSLSGLADLGAGAALLTRPGPNGGTEIVNSNGDTVYSEQQVAANPSLLSNLPSPCPGGLLPTWFPGGESICADNNNRTSEGTVASPQFNYPINGACMDGTWCMTGSNPLDPNSYQWTGGGSPTSINPAVMMGANPLPSVYNTPSGSPPAQSVPPAVITQPQSTPGTVPSQSYNPVSNVLNPPPTGSAATGVTPQSIANGSPQSANGNVSAGVNTPTLLDQLESEAQSATGLSGSTLLLIGAGLIALMVLKK